MASSAPEEPMVRGRCLTDRVALASARPIALGTGVLSVLFAGAYLAVLAEPMRTPMALLAAGTAVALLALWVALDRWRPPARAGHPILLGIGALLQVNGLVHLYLSGDPLQTSHPILVLIAAGVVLLSLRWLLLLLLLTWAGWLPVALTAPPSPLWVHFGCVLFSATALALVAHALRIRTLREVEQLQTREQAQTRRLEAALRAAHRSNQRFRRLAEATFEGIVVHSAGEIIDANETCARMLGYEVHDLFGRDLVETITPGSRALEREGAANGDEPPHEIEGQRRDGTPLPLEVHSSPLPAEGPAVRVVALRDITARKRRQAELANALVELKRSNEELEQFAYVASHDLQAPLRTVAGFSKILRADHADELSATANSYLERIAAGVGQMERLLRDLLTYSRVGSHHRPFGPVDLDRALSAALNNLRQDLQEANVKLVREPLPLVTGDRVRLAQLMQNLLANAIKFRSDRPPEVRVSARRDGDSWTVSVSDNGIGIAPRYHDKVFQVFERLHPTEAYPGTGIGLAICKRIVEMHGGRIWLESTHGEGTTVNFSLPAAQA